MKTLYERNDFEQKKLMTAYSNRASRILDEKERLARTRAQEATIDIAINSYDGAVEMYIPVKQDQKGPLTNLIREYCTSTFEKTAGKAEHGEYKGFAVLRTGKNIKLETLAERITKDSPGRLEKYNVTLSTATNFRFASEAKYNGSIAAEPKAETAKPEKAETEAKEPYKGPSSVKHTSRIPKNDVLQIKTWVKQGLSIDQIAKKSQKYDKNEVLGITNHIKMGTYDRPMQEISDHLEQKLFKEFESGKTNDVIAEKYELNKFQVIARRAKHTRLNNKVK